MVLLLGWAGAHALGGGGPSGSAPPALVPHPSPGTPSVTSASGQQATLYRPTALDGHWVTGPLSETDAAAIAGTRSGERLTLVTRSSALVVWVGSAARPEQRILAYEAATVGSHRIQLRPVGISHQVGVYAWSVRGRELHFRLLRRTPGATPPAMLVRPTYAEDVSRG